MAVGSIPSKDRGFNSHHRSRARSVFGPSWHHANADNAGFSTSWAICCFCCLRNARRNNRTAGLLKKLGHLIYCIQTQLSFFMFDGRDVGGEKNAIWKRPDIQWDEPMRLFTRLLKSTSLQATAGGTTPSDPRRLRDRPATDGGPSDDGPSSSWLFLFTKPLYESGGFSKNLGLSTLFLAGVTWLRAVIAREAREDSVSQSELYVLRHTSA